MTNVHLPNEFADNMQEESIWHTRSEYKGLQQKYELRKIEARELESKNKQKANEDMQNFEAKKDSEVAGYAKKFNLVKAKTEKQVAKVKEEEQADILKINSNSKVFSLCFER